MGGRGASSGKEKGGAGGASSGKGALTIGGVTDSKNYPALSGSEKQVAWATAIRDKYFHWKAGDFSSKMHHTDPSKNWSQEKLQERMAKFKETYSHPSWSQAKTWIDARHTLLPYG